MTNRNDTKFRFRALQHKLLARMLRYSTIPLIHKKRLVHDIIPYLLADNSSLDYRWFFRMVIGEDYKGDNYDV
jgi:hypothetical protein